MTKCWLRLAGRDVTASAFFLFSDLRGTAAEEGKEARVSCLKGLSPRNQFVKHKGQEGEGQTGVCYLFRDQMIYFGAYLVLFILTASADSVVTIMSKNVQKALLSCLFLCSN